MLLLLRQNFVDFGTQKHCIEIVESATTLINPGQTIVDKSGEPVYALPKKLQQMYPHKFGQRRYLPMFGRLHIEKILLEIHGQLLLVMDFLGFFTIQNFQSLVLEIYL